MHIGLFVSDSSSDDRGNTALNLPVDVADLSLHRTPPIGAAGASPFLIVAAHEIGDRLPGPEFVAQPADDGTLDLVQIVGAAIVAGARFAHARADDARTPVVDVLLRHASAASTTAQEPGQDALGCCPRPAPLDGARRAKPLRLRKVAVLDDAQVRRLGALPLAFRPVAPNPLAGVRIAHPVGTIPNHPAAIELVLQEAGPPRGVAVDGRGAPIGGARCRHTLGIEAGRDRARRLTGDVFSKNAPHDLSARGDDLKLAGPAGDRHIAVHGTAVVSTVADDRGHAAADHDLHILELMRIHNGFDAIHHARYLAVDRRVNRNTGKSQSLSRCRSVLFITAITARRLGTHCLKDATFGVGEHALKIGALMHTGTGLRSIDIDGGNKEAEALHVGSTNGLLILRRPLILSVA